MGAVHSTGRRGIWRFLPLAVLAVGLTLFFAFGLDDYVTLQTLRENRDFLLDWVARQHLVAALVFMAVYILAVAFSLPGGTLLSLMGGLMFGVWEATAYIVFAATLGATALFLAARTALSAPLRARAGPWLEKLQHGFRDNGFSYLLFLRLVPLFPFFAVNLVPAFLGVSLRQYIAATLIGIIPGSAVYAYVGQGLGDIFASRQEFSLSGILSPQLLTALTLLGLLALVPALYKRFRGRGRPSA